MVRGADDGLVDFGLPGAVTVVTIPGFCCASSCTWVFQEDIHQLGMHETINEEWRRSEADMAKQGFVNKF